MKEMDEIWNNRQYIYSIPEKILFDTELTLNDLRIYCVVGSYECITRDFVKEQKGRLENYWYEGSIDKSIEMLLAKCYLVEEEGFLSISNKYLLDYICFK
jgi:hypothetical protein